MSCCCDNQSQGLSGLYGLDGLNGLMGALASGSQVSVGFAYESSASRDDINAGRTSPAYIQNMLVGNLVEFGVFDRATVIIEEPWWGGSIADGYITVKGITYAEQSSSRNISSVIERMIGDYLPFIRITKRNDVVIEAIPAGAQGRSGFEQPNVTKYFPQQNQNVQQPLAPGECDLGKQDFGDWVACQLGIKSAIGGVAAGATGALVGVGVLTLLAVVVLKR